MSARADSGSPSGLAAGPEKYDNTDEATETFEQLEANQQEQRDEWREATSKQRSIEQSLRSDTVELPVGGEPIQFTAFRSREKSQWAASAREELRKISSEEVEAEAPKQLDRVYAELAERSGPEWMDQQWWEDNASIKLALDYIELILSDTNLSVREFKSFRNH